jgi:hypothetical protein
MARCRNKLDYVHFAPFFVQPIPAYLECDWWERQLLAELDSKKRIPSYYPTILPFVAIRVI